MLTPQTRIAGTLTKIVFQRDGFVIGRIDSPSGGNISVKGDLAAPQIGMEYEFAGRIEQSKWGATFCFSEYRSILPTDSRAVESYLIENCMFVGPAVARRLTDEYGEAVLTTCKTQPDAVAAKIKGITPDRAGIIAKLLLKNEQYEQVQIGLKEICTGAKISKRAVTQIIRAWGLGSVDKIRSNPYRLTEFAGIGFRKADLVARNLDYDLESPYRVRAGILYVLDQAASGAGHCYLPATEFFAAAQEVLAVKHTLLVEVAQQMLAGNELAGEPVDAPAWIAISKLYAQEVAIAAKIQKMLATAPRTISLDQEKMQGLADDQIAAVEDLLSSRIAILTGAPGTGKSHLVSTLIQMFANANIALAAPTGKAAARMAELCERSARTIHSLLEPQVTKVDDKLHFQFQRNADKPLDCSVLIVDEASMLDVSLAARLFAAIRPATRVLLVGDIDQLSPVGPGDVLRDLIAAGVPTATLTTIKRQNAGLIVRNCHAIRDRREIAINNDRDSDFYFIENDDPGEIARLIVELHSTIAEQFEIDPIRDIQVISPRREKSHIACSELNETLQASLNPLAQIDADRKPGFLRGDKVIQTRNDYEKGIINGDIGYVYRIVNEHKLIEVDFVAPERHVTLPLFQNDLRLGYALTVHKYQGSEAPAVIFPIHKCFGKLILQRNLVYTAISRAQRCIVVVGQVAELKAACRREKAAGRYTHLQRLLQAGSINLI
jgi:exodeoxyribonuclease V alpha subunit